MDARLCQQTLLLSSDQRGLPLFAIFLLFGSFEKAITDESVLDCSTNHLQQLSIKIK